MNKSKCALAVAFTLGTALLVQGAGQRGGLSGGGRGGGRGGRGAGGAGSAATQQGSGPAASQRAATEAAEVTALRPAFNLLLDADHDYQGHRAKAMIAIAEACRMMGTDIVPPGLKEHLENAGDGAKSTGGGHIKARGNRRETCHHRTRIAKCLRSAIAAGVGNRAAGQKRHRQRQAVPAWANFWTRRLRISARPSRPNERRRVIATIIS